MVVDKAEHRNPMSTTVDKAEHRNPMSTAVGKAEHRNPVSTAVDNEKSNPKNRVSLDSKNNLNQGKIAMVRSGPMKLDKPKDKTCLGCCVEKVQEFHIRMSKKEAKAHGYQEEESHKDAEEGREQI
ncbi:hypothetical protein GBA52_020328 [Prunus armeniaca]|nr:hypothetical protein GBA52_020328 [Prunus armeniaca]